MKALVLFSGGLDSRLAIKLLQEQGIKIEAVTFILPFGAGCCKSDCAFKFTQMNGIKSHIIECTGKLFNEYIKIIRKPMHGTGAGLNPCIDCRIFILKKAKKLAKKINADFIATGEVLNERPMSQHKNAMLLVERKSGLKGRLLRPLSAKLLDETEIERKGMVDREKLLDISGRCRKRQIELAKKYRISFPSPAGGCLLCEKEFAKKLKDLFAHKKRIEMRDIELLRIGRHFRNGRNKIIVGRNEAENKVLLALKTKGELVIEARDVPGPITIVQGRNIKLAAAITMRYADADSGFVRAGRKTIFVKAIGDKELEQYRIR